MIILLVDIGCHFRMKLEAELHKGSTYTGSAMGGIDEERPPQASFGAVP